MKSTTLVAAALTLCTAGPLTAMNEMPSTEQGATELSVLISEADYEISPFCKAILEGDYDTVAKMIELGEDVNRKSLGKTPVIYAARYNRHEILELLLDSGADPDIKCDRGYSAVKHAELSSAHDALRVLRSS